MNWNEIIERNVERLVAVLTELFVMAGFGRAGTAFLPRFAHHVAPRRIRCAMPGGWRAGRRGGV